MESNESKEGCRSISNFEDGMAALKEFMQPAGWEHVSETRPAVSRLNFGKLCESGELQSGVGISGTKLL